MTSIMIRIEIRPDDVAAIVVEHMPPTPGQTKLEFETGNTLAKNIQENMGALLGGGQVFGSIAGPVGLAGNAVNGALDRFRKGGNDLG